MPDIAGKLFPNLTTLIVQLLSTGVLLLIFKKFLWKNVMEYFAKRADYIESTINEAKEMNEKASALYLLSLHFSFLSTFLFYTPYFKYAIISLS